MGSKKDKENFWLKMTHGIDRKSCASCDNLRNKRKGRTCLPKEHVLENKSEFSCVLNGYQYWVIDRDFT